MGEASGNGYQPLVLAADDDEDILSLVAFRLERVGHEVVTASDGEDALQLALDRTPELAVLDVMMPRMTGLDVTREVRRNESMKRMPVIRLTARVQEADVATGFEAGVDDYLKKTFSPQEFRARVRAALGCR